MINAAAAIRRVASTSPWLGGWSPGRVVVDEDDAGRAGFERALDDFGRG